MCWRPSKGIIDGTKILHLRLNPQDQWKPYTSFPQYAVADYGVPKGSLGWATYQRLRECGWELVPSAWGDVNPEEDLTSLGSEPGEISSASQLLRAWVDVYGIIAD